MVSQKRIEEDMKIKKVRLKNLETDVKERFDSVKNNVENNKSKNNLFKLIFSNY